MPDINVMCFSHVGITVRDLEASLEFYGNLFGFERLFDDGHDDWRRVGLKVGDVQLELFSPFPGRTPHDVLDPYYPMEFGRPKIALTVSDVDATYARLLANGMKPLCASRVDPAFEVFLHRRPGRNPDSAARVSRR